MTKPINPNISIPEGFATEGQKTNFSTEKIQNGFNPVEPDVLAGDNLNKFIDDVYKGLNYTLNGVEDLYKSAVKYNYAEVYARDSIVFYVDSNSKVHICRSLVDNNVGNDLSNSNYWADIIFNIDENAYVSKTGDTMTGALNINSTSPNPVNIKMEQIDSAVTPSANQYACLIKSNDVNSIRMSAVETGRFTNGDHCLILTERKSATESQYATFRLGWNSAQNKFAQFDCDVHITEKTFNKWYDNFVKGTAPSAVKTGGLIFRDQNSASIGFFDVRVGTDNQTTARMAVYPNTAGSTDFTSIQVGYNSSGNIYTSAPACQDNNSIVTTVAKSKAANGYYKLGNGLIIQWGKNTINTSDTEITLPTAFTSTNYRVIAMDSANKSGTAFRNLSGGASSTTKFKLCSNGDNTSTSWVAIGY